MPLTVDVPDNDEVLDGDGVSDALGEPLELGVSVRDGETLGVDVKLGV